MKRKIKLFLCFTVFVAAMSTPSVYAGDLIVNTDEAHEVQSDFDFDNLKNSGKITNNCTVNVIDNFVNNDNSTIEGENGVLNILKQGTNNGFITQKNFEISSWFFDNNGTLNVTGTLLIVSNLNNEGEINAAYIQNNGIIEGEGGNFVVGGGINKNEINQSKFTNNGTFKNDESAKLISKTINNNDSMTNFGEIGSSKNKAAITNNGTFKNSGSVYATTILNKEGKTFTNDAGKTVIADSVVNNGTFSNLGELVTPYIKNKKSGTFENSHDLTTTTIKNAGIFKNANNIVVSNLKNTQTIEGAGQLEITKGYNSGNIVQSAIVVKESLYQGENASIVVDDLTNNINSVIENNGSITINDTLSNVGSILNKGTFNSGAILENTGTFINSGENANFDAIKITSNNIFGVDNGAQVFLESINNENGKIYLTNNGSLTVTNQIGTIGGEVIAQNGMDNIFNINTSDFVGNLTVGGSNTALDFNSGSITEDAIVNIERQGRLAINIGSDLILNNGDTVLGDIVNYGEVTLDGFNLTTGENSTLQGGALAYYKQTGGTLNIINNSTLSMGDSNLITGGKIFIDDNSAYLSRQNGFIVENFKSSGLLGAMNSDIEDYLMNDMIIGNSATGKNQADLTIDVYGRSNAYEEHATDMFIANNIKEDSGLSDAVINISDWGLAGDIFGWDAPIDRDITLENIFSGNISENVSLTATRKEVFTPIGWYQLNNHGGTTGNYTLNLTRFNPQVYRGQVTTLAQWMNQLAIDDMLFNHSMLLPSFKDEDGGMAYSGVMANRYASVDPVFAPYQYSRKDGGLWYKMYGTFETMQMSQGLNNIGNNAYGALIGADFGLRELKNGWKYMPTAYIGYNGAHQYYSGVGAYQNGGQIGFLNTLYKNNFILGGLIYGGVYDNAIDVAGRNDNTFNYFGGAAAKAAYNVRLHRDWVLQPNLFAAYNYFGQQNWHSTYGQMGMMSGMLNGVNIAPGLNLIWEKETFSIYGTLQYMYNANGAIGGRAGNVNLPHLCMDRGYIQYGLGFTKRISDRFSGYLQAVLRNVGRTGVGFQMGFNIQLGK